MNTRFKVLLSLLLLSALPAAVQAQFNYRSYGNGTCFIVSYTGTGGAVNIPDTIDGLTVVAIGGSQDGVVGFWNCTSITSVTIPDTVTMIEGDAFVGCSSMTSITIPNSVTFIGTWAFAGCTNLTSITIPDSITSIADYTFNGCSSLTNATIPSSVTSIGISAFSSSGLTSVAIPDSVTSIGYWAFSECTSLSSVTVHSTSIGNSAFSGCTSLTSVTMGTNVTSIADYAFQNCYALANVLIGTNVTSIGDHAFGNCGLTSVTIPGSVTSIGYWAFGGCTSLTGVYFQGNAPSLGSTQVFVYYPATAYYLPGTTNWYTPFGGISAVLWNPQMQTSDASFGLRTNRFGFNITGSSGMGLVVEACTDLANPVWSPVSTNTLTGGSSYFSDPQWTNYPTRFYRLSMP